MTFLQFLKANGEPYVTNELAAMTDEIDSSSMEEPDNVFAISSMLMNMRTKDPQRMLQHLVNAYNWWLVTEIKRKRKALERCISANRVIFTEENGMSEAKRICWSGVNNSLTTLASGMQEAETALNFMSSIKVTK